MQGRYRRGHRRICVLADGQAATTLLDVGCPAVFRHQTAPRNIPLVEEFRSRFVWTNEILRWLGWTEVGLEAYVQVTLPIRC